MIDENLRTKWTEATGNLPWGVYSVFREAFQLVADEDIKLVYGADVSDGSPCLVNSVHNMLSNRTLSPYSAFPTIVSLFDDINRALLSEGVNKDNYVSPLAAEIFLAWFAPEPPMPELTGEQIAQAIEANTTATVYREPDDAEIARDWLEAVKNEALAEPSCSTDEEVPTE